MSNYTVPELEELLSKSSTYVIANRDGSESEEPVDPDNDLDEYFSMEHFCRIIEDQGTVTFNSSNGEKIFGYWDENSIIHDGGEIGCVFEINDQIFRVPGSYSSHDINYWEDATEVIKEVKLVPTVFYHVKK